MEDLTHYMSKDDEGLVKTEPASNVPSTSSQPLCHSQRAPKPISREESIYKNPMDAL